MLPALGEYLVAVGTGSREAELSAGRDAIWKGALEAVGSELGSTPMTSTQRSNRNRARRLLDGAVNGQLDLARPADLAFDHEGEAGFRDSYVEHLAGPDSMVVGIK